MQLFRRVGVRAVLLAMIPATSATFASDALNRPKIYAAGTPTEVQLSNPLTWLSGEVLVFAGSQTVGERKSASLYLWQVDSSPVEVLSGSFGEIVEIIPKTPTGGVLKATNFDRATKTLTSSYFTFDSSGGAAVTAVDYEADWNANLENLRATEALKRRAADATNSATGSKIYIWSDAELAPDRASAVTFKVLHPRGAGPSELLEWSKSNCRPFYKVEIASQRVAKECLPYGGWTRVLFSPLVAARETLFVAHAFNSESWEPKYFGIYRLAGMRVENIYPGKHINQWVLSPDGCKVGVVGREASADAQTDVSNRNLSLEVLDLCYSE